LKDDDLINNPLVSVIVPLYNGEDYIAECLTSVYNQTYRPFEVFIVDDGSTDRSIEIVNKIARDKRIISQKNEDVCRARNVGSEQSKGEFIAFIDQDDIWDPSKLSRQLEIFQTDDTIDLVFTDIIKFFPSGRKHHAMDKHRIALSLTEDNLFGTLVKKNVLMTSAVMVKRESFIKAGMFDEDFKTCGDYEMWIRMAQLGMKFRYLPEPLTFYRYHGRNTSQKTEVMHNDRVKAIRKTFSDDLLKPEYKKLERISLANVYMFGAHTYFSSKNYREFLDNSKKALSYSLKVISLKFITRYIRSVLFIWIRKNPTNE